MYPVGLEQALYECRTQRRLEKRPVRPAQDFSVELDLFSVPLISNELSSCYLVHLQIEQVIYSWVMSNNFIQTNNYHMVSCFICK